MKVCRFSVIFTQRCYSFGECACAFKRVSFFVLFRKIWIARSFALQTRNYLRCNDLLEYYRFGRDSGWIVFFLCQYSEKNKRAMEILFGSSKYRLQIGGKLNLKCMIELFCRFGLFKFCYGLKRNHCQIASRAYSPFQLIDRFYEKDFFSIYSLQYEDCSLYIPEIAFKSIWEVLIFWHYNKAVEILQYDTNI